MPLDAIKVWKKVSCLAPLHLYLVGKNRDLPARKDVPEVCSQHRLLFVEWLFREGGSSDVIG